MYSANRCAFTTAGLSPICGCGINPSFLLSFVCCFPAFRKVDFEEDMMRSAFAVVNNPVSESACGCGSSFALKNFEKNPALD